MGCATLRASHNFWILTIIGPNANAGRAGDFGLGRETIFKFSTDLEQCLGLLVQIQNLLPLEHTLFFVSLFFAFLFWSGLNAVSCIFDAKYKAAINSTRNLRTKVRVMRQESPRKKGERKRQPRRN